MYLCQLYGILSKDSFFQAPLSDYFTSSEVHIFMTMPEKEHVSVETVSRLRHVRLSSQHCMADEHSMHMWDALSMSKLWKNYLGGQNCLSLSFNLFSVC